VFVRLLAFPREVFGGRHAQYLSGGAHARDPIAWSHK
jgi:hypothetical protein